MQFLMLDRFNFIQNLFNKINFFLKKVIKIMSKKEYKEIIKGFDNSNYKIQNDSQYSSSSKVRLYHDNSGFQNQEVKLQRNLDRKGKINVKIIDSIRRKIIKQSKITEELQDQIYIYSITQQKQGQEILDFFKRVPKNESLLFLLRFIFYSIINNKIPNIKIEQILESIKNQLKSKYRKMKLYSSQNFQEILYIHSLANCANEQKILQYLGDIIQIWIPFISENQYHYLIQSAKYSLQFQFFRKKIQFLNAFDKNIGLGIFAEFRYRFINFYHFYSKILQIQKNWKVENFIYLSPKNILKLSYENTDIYWRFLKFLRSRELKPLQYGLQMYVNVDKQNLIQIKLKNILYQINVNRPNEIIEYASDKQKKITVRAEFQPISEKLSIKIKAYQEKINLTLNSNQYNFDLTQESYQIFIKILDSFILESLHLKQQNIQKKFILNQLVSIFSQNQEKKKLKVQINQVARTQTFGTITSEHLNLKNLYLLFQQINQHIQVEKVQVDLIKQMIDLGEQIKNEEQKVLLANIIAKCIVEVDLVNILEIIEKQLYELNKKQIQINMLSNFIIRILLNFQILKNTPYPIQIKAIDIIEILLASKKFAKVCCEYGILFYKIIQINDKYFRLQQTTNQESRQSIIEFQNTSQYIVKKLVEINDSNTMIYEMEYLIILLSSEKHIDSKIPIFSSIYEYIIKSYLFQDTLDFLIQEGLDFFKETQKLTPDEINFFTKNNQITSMFKFVKNPELRLKISLNSIKLAQNVKDYSKYVQILMSIFNEQNIQQYNKVYQIIGKEIKQLQKLNLSDLTYGLIELLILKYYRYGKIKFDQSNDKILFKFLYALEGRYSVSLIISPNTTNFLLKNSTIEFLICIMLQNRVHENYQKKLLIYNYISIVLSKFSKSEFLRFIQIYRKQSNSDLWILSELINFFTTHKAQSVFVKQISLQYCYEIIWLMADSHAVPKSYEEGVVDIVSKYLIRILQKMQKKQHIWEQQAQSNQFIRFPVFNLDNNFIEIGGPIFYKLLLVALLMLEKFPTRLNSKYLQVLDRVNGVMIKIQEMKSIINDAQKNKNQQQKNYNKCVFVYLEYVYLKIKVILDSGLYFKVKNEVSQKLEEILANIQMNYQIQILTENIKFYIDKLITNKQFILVEEQNVSEVDSTLKILQIQYQYIFYVKKKNQQYNQDHSKHISQLLSQYKQFIQQFMQNSQIELKKKKLLLSQESNSEQQIEYLENHLKLSLSMFLDFYYYSPNVRISKTNQIFANQSIENSEALKVYHKNYVIPYYKSKRRLADSQLFWLLIKTEAIIEQYNCSDFIYQLQYELYKYSTVELKQSQDLVKFFTSFTKKTSLLVLFRYIFYGSIKKFLDHETIEKLLTLIISRLGSSFESYKLHSIESFQQVLYIHSLNYFAKGSSILDKLNQIIIKWIPLIKEKQYFSLFQSAKQIPFSQFLKKRLQILKNFGVEDFQNIFKDFSERIMNFYNLYLDIFKIAQNLIENSVIYSAFSNKLQLDYSVLQDVAEFDEYQPKQYEHLEYDIQMLMNTDENLRETIIQIKTMTMVYEIDINKPNQIVQYTNNSKKIVNCNNFQPISYTLHINIKNKKDQLVLILNGNKYKFTVNQKSPYTISIKTVDSFFIGGVSFKQQNRITNFNLHETLTFYTNYEIKTKLVVKINQVNQIDIGKMKSYFNLRYLFAFFRQIFSHLKLSKSEINFINDLIVSQQSLDNQEEKIPLVQQLARIIHQSLNPNKEIFIQQFVKNSLNKSSVKQQKVEQNWNKFIQEVYSIGEMFYEQSFTKKPILKLRNIELPDFSRPIMKLTDDYEYNLENNDYIRLFQKPQQEKKIEEDINDNPKEIAFTSKCELIKRRGGYFCDIMINQSKLYIQIKNSKTQRPKQKPYLYGIPPECLLNDPIKPKKILLSQIEEIINKKFNQILNNSIEIYLKNGKCYFLNFYLAEKVEEFYTTLQKYLYNKDIIIRNPIEFFEKRKYTEQWRYHELSNFEYIMIINKYSSRSYNDLSQPYIFPWVLKEFQSQEIDLNNPKIYRDLNQPIAFLNPKKKLSMVAKFLQSDYCIKYFFISSLYYNRYLIRMQPYTTQSYKISRNRFDFYSRRFTSVGDQFQRIVDELNQQMIQLTPEFYYLPSFLININNVKFDEEEQNDDNVKLPLWAENNTNRFISIMRAAIQSDYVSENLPKWIDLIFGHRRYEAITVNKRQTNGEQNIQIKPSHSFKDIHYHQNINYLQLESELREQYRQQNQKKAKRGLKPKDENALQLQIQSQLLSRLNYVYSFGQFPLELFLKPHPSRLKFERIQNSGEEYEFQIKPRRFVKQMILINRKVYFKIQKRDKIQVKELILYEPKRLKKIKQLTEAYKELKIMENRSTELYLLSKNITITIKKIKDVVQSKIFLQKFDIHFTYKKAVAGTRFVAFCGKALRILDYQGNEQYYWDQQQTLDCVFTINKFIFITSSGLIYTYDYVKRELRVIRVNLIEIEKQKDLKRKLHLKFLVYEFQSIEYYIVVANQTKIIVVSDRNGQVVQAVANRYN